MNRNNFANTLRILVLSLILSTAVGYSLAAWVPPSGAPPNGNPPPPINVGGVAQVRDGNLYLNQWIIAAWAQFGKVGIGTTPTATSPALTINGKAQSSPTVAEDPANTLTTKGYVDAQASGGKITYFYKNKVCNSGVASGGYYVLNYAAKVPSTASSVIVSAYASSGVDPSHLYIKESLPENTNDMIRVVELGVLSGAGDRNMVFLPTTAARNFYIYKTGSTSYCLEGYVE